MVAKLASALKSKIKEWFVETARDQSQTQGLAAHDLGWPMVNHVWTAWKDYLVRQPTTPPLAFCGRSLRALCIGQGALRIPGPWNMKITE
jgi:hypothetical protein